MRYSDNQKALFRALPYNTATTSKDLLNILDLVNAADSESKNSAYDGIEYRDWTKDANNPCVPDPNGDNNVCVPIPNLEKNKPKDIPKPVEQIEDIELELNDEPADSKQKPKEVRKGNKKDKHQKGKEIEGNQAKEKEEEEEEKQPKEKEKNAEGKQSKEIEAELKENSKDNLEFLSTDVDEDEDQNGERMSFIPTKQKDQK